MRFAREGRPQRFRHVGRATGPEEIALQRQLQFTFQFFGRNRIVRFAPIPCDVSSCEHPILGAGLEDLTIRVANNKTQEDLMTTAVDELKQPKRRKEIYKEIFKENRKSRKRRRGLGGSRQALDAAGGSGLPQGCRREGLGPERDIMRHGTASEARTEGESSEEGAGPVENDHFPTALLNDRTYIFAYETRYQDGFVSCF